MTSFLVHVQIQLIVEFFNADLALKVALLWFLVNTQLMLEKVVTQLES